MSQFLRTLRRPLVQLTNGRLFVEQVSTVAKIQAIMLPQLLAARSHILIVGFLMLSLVSCVSGQTTQKTKEAPLSEDAVANPSGMAMPISGIQTVFANDLTQWDVFDYEGERAGTLNLRFPVMTTGTGDLTQWVFRMGDYDGIIKPKVNGREDFWEIRVNNEVVTMRPVFQGQYDQWAISDGRNRIVYAVRDFALLEYWSTRGPGGPGLVEMYTRFEGDPTDWEFYDEANKPVNAAQQLAMLWLPVYIRLTAL